MVSFKGIDSHDNGVDWHGGNITIQRDIKYYGKLKSTNTEKEAAITLVQLVSHHQ